MNRFFFSFIFALVSLCFPFLYKAITGGFRLSKLCHLSKIGEVTNQCAMSEELKPLLEQPFHYLGRGMQTFVFESQDSEIVIKLFKMRRKGKREELLKTFKACELAFDLAKEETGLLHIHLHKTDEKFPKVFLKNRLGFPCSLDLEKYPFVIQRKAKPFQQMLPSDFSEALIDAYLALVYKRSQKGICNTDANLQRNFGWLEGNAVEIDFGNYQYDPEKKESEFLQFASRMRALLQKIAPEKLAEYDQKVAAYL